MEESVELIKSQLSKHRFFLIPLIQKLHLDQNHAFTTVCAHAVSRGDRELVIKVDKLTVMNLFEQVLKLLCVRTTFDLVDGSDTIINVSRVLGHTHLLQSLQLLVFGHAL